MGGRCTGPRFVSSYVPRFVSPPRLSACAHDAGRLRGQPRSGRSTRWDQTDDAEQQEQPLVRQKSSSCAGCVDAQLSRMAAAGCKGCPDDALPQRHGHGRHAGCTCKLQRRLKSSP